MENNALYLPLLVQVTLSLLVLFWLSYARLSRLAKLGKDQIRKNGFPQFVTNASDNLKNQFEVPVLFYAICFYFITSGNVTQTVLYAAWAFVILRIIHALIHLTKNIIFPYRFMSFLLSVVALLVMLVIAFIQVLS